jgi:TRAP-type mannitol/chloroaromatic compound transport system permease small subunit
MLIPVGTFLVILQGISELLKNIMVVFSLKRVE